MRECVFCLISNGKEGGVCRKIPAFNAKAKNYSKSYK